MVMTVLERELFITYSQLAVFNSDLENPFNDWNASHVRQGFSWRPGSVSFRTLFETGMLQVRVVFDADAQSLKYQPKRGIRVPFEVTASGLVEIASISDGFQILVSPGMYSVICYMGCGDESYEKWCVVAITDQGPHEPSIVVCDDEIVASEPLLMRAEPAG